jgi:adenylosuccinate lyase
VSIHLADSTVYGHLWSTAEAHAILDEEARFAAWLDILAALAETQAELGLVPGEAASAIRAFADGGKVDLERVAEGTRATGHSTLGLIRFLRSSLPPEVREWVYFGATVQDLTDTWTSTVMRRIGDLVDRDLARLQEACLRHATEHRTTPMLGRTHAQPGLPITFGFKAAVWAAEIARHRRRLAEGRQRWEVAQLGGALGTMEFWGDAAIPLLEAFSSRLGLRAPVVPWITARDGPAEFAHVMAMIATTVAKLGNEIMELQRLEMGELAERFTPGTVGSITMPQKRNPELSEHLDTLARLVRANAAVVTEGMVQLHERDGRAWKAEWVAIPEVCALTLASTGFGATLVEGLVVNADRMAANIASQNGYVFAEPVMRALADRVGKHVATDVVYQAAMNGVESGVGLIDALAGDPRVTDHLTRADIEALLDVERAVGSAPAFVDRVVEGLR